MSEAKMGANVEFCGHNGWFIADIFVVGNVNVVRANGPVTSGNINRKNLDSITHTMSDFPTAGFWRPDLGVFVVPKAQVKEVKKPKAKK